MKDTPEILEIRSLLAGLSNKRKVAVVQMVRDEELQEQEESHDAHSQRSKTRGIANSSPAITPRPPHRRLTATKVPAPMVLNMRESLLGGSELDDFFHQALNAKSQFIASPVVSTQQAMAAVRDSLRKVIEKENQRIQENAYTDLEKAASSSRTCQAQHWKQTPDGHKEFGFTPADERRPGATQNEEDASKSGTELPEPCLSAAPSSTFAKINDSPINLELDGKELVEVLKKWISELEVEPSKKGVLKPL